MSAARRELVDQMEGRMSSLKEALHAIETTKQALRENSVEVKSQIHSVVSRQLESLRNREVWLLGQVDVLEDSKEAVLRTQEAQLHHALGQLANSLECSGDDDGLRVTGALTRSLDRVNELQLKPLESAHISFGADVVGMRRVIRDFGCVNSQALEMPFVGLGQATSMCLPHAFEDYGDAEHHILYKTLEDVKREHQEDGTSLSIKVEIPRLVEPMAEWLAWTPGTTPTPTPTSSKGGHFTFPPFGAGGAAVDSIHQWLADIKLETEVEEEDFEIINAAGARSVSESSSLEMLAPCEEAEDAEGHETVAFPQFESVQAAPQSDWLLQGGQGGGDDCDAIERSAKTLAYFTQAMGQNEKWLADFTTGKLAEVTEPVEGKGTCCESVCDQTKKNPDVIDIENLVDLLPCIDVDNPVFTQVQQSSASLWLQLPGGDNDDDDKDIDEVTESVRGLCRANEVCSSFSECVADENCLPGSDHASPTCGLANAELGNGSAGCKNMPENVLAWFAQLKNTALMDEIKESPLFAYFRTLSTVQDHWLAQRAGVKVNAVENNLFPVFSSVLRDSVWLQQQVNIESSSPATSGCDVPSDVPLHREMAAICQTSNSNWQCDEESMMNKSTPKPEEADLTHLEHHFSPIADEKHKWLSAKDPGCDSTAEELPIPCPSIMAMPSSFCDRSGDINQWLSQPAMLTKSSTPTTTDDTFSLVNPESPSTTIVKPSCDTNTTTATTVSLSPRSHPVLVRSNPRWHKCNTDNKIWLQKKSLSVEEDDLDVPLMSETVAASVSSLFAKMGLGHGPWLRDGDNYHSPSKLDDEKEEEDEEDDAHWLIKKESCTSLEKSISLDTEDLPVDQEVANGELFSCFQEKAKNMSKWLSTSDLED